MSIQWLQGQEDSSGGGSEEKEQIFVVYTVLSFVLISLYSVFKFIHTDTDVSVLSSDQSSQVIALASLWSC